MHAYLCIWPVLPNSTTVLCWFYYALSLWFITMMFILWGRNIFNIKVSFEVHWVWRLFISVRIELFAIFRLLYNYCYSTDHTHNAVFMHSFSTAYIPNATPLDNLRDNITDIDPLFKEAFIINKDSLSDFTNIGKGTNCC